MNGKPSNIALYWDFENMHASVLNNEGSSLVGQSLVT